LRLIFKNRFRNKLNLKMERDVRFTLMFKFNTRKPIKESNEGALNSNLPDCWMTFKWQKENQYTWCRFLFAVSTVTEWSLLAQLILSMFEKASKWQRTLRSQLGCEFSKMRLQTTTIRFTPERVHLQHVLPFV
jgi:hypothetical protein